MTRTKQFISVFIDIVTAMTILSAAAVIMLMLCGGRVFCVQTGSMEPDYPVGSVIVVWPTQCGELSEGDVITFTSSDVLVTHRIISVDAEKSEFHTKGDNNNVADTAAVSFDSVIGKVVFCIKYIGYAGLFFRTTYGIITGCGIILFLILIRAYYNLIKKEETNV